MTTLPVQTKVRSAVYPPGWYMAKSGLGIQTQKLGPKLVFGFAFGEDAEEAKVRSQYEVYERVYAHYDLFAANLSNAGEIPVLNWETHEKIGACKSEDVLFSHPLKKTGWVDANGLAWHSSLAQAIRGGMWEILERHQLSRWWHLSEISLVPLSQTTEQLFTVESFTTTDAIPMAIVVIRGRNCEFLVCGSACADGMELSLSKAHKEAYMMLDGVLAQDQGNANHPVSRDKLMTLRDPETSRLRYQHIQNSAIDIKATIPTKQTNLRLVLKELELDSDAAGYCLLHQQRDQCLVRAIVPDARNPKEFGGRHETPPDPFC